jgi:hypothetical protein
VSRRFWFALWSSSLLLLLTACGNASGADSSHTHTTTNTSPGTQTSGPVSIATNHTVYGPTDPIQVTVRNKLSTPIYALDTQASCSILGLEVQVNAAWQAASVARCPLGRPAMVVKLAVGKADTITIQAGSSMMKNAAFPSGTYRLLLNYSTTGSGASILSKPTTVSSMPFAVSGSVPPGTPGSGPPTQPTSVPPPATPS